MSRHHSLAEVKQALVDCHGCAYLTAERLGVWPSAVYARIKKSKELQALLDLYDGRRTDVAELKLEQAIQNGEAWAIQFQLKTKGRNRGYVERREVETSGRLNVEVEPRISPELDKQIRRVLGVVAAGGQASPLGEGDRLPKEFRSSD